MADIYPVNINASHAAKNPLDEQQPEEQPVNLYKPEDQEYLTFLQVRLQNSKKQADQPSPHLNNRTRYQYYEDNEKAANTWLPDKKNDDDVVISSGTIEQKLDSVLSHINNLNLSLEVFAFDRENNRVTDLAAALQDIIHDTKIRETDSDGGGDDEKKMIRQRELLKQGTVFVQEEWVRKFEIRKKLKKKFDGRFKQDADFYSSSLELVFDGPSSTLLYGPNVYLGDETEFYMERQPYVFVLVRQDYDVAKARFGQFENWKYVKKGAVASGTPDTQKTIFENKWRLSELTANQVEIIMYQDRPRDEFQIIINGVCMLPIGFPLSAVVPGGGYNIVKQVFRVLHDKYAFGGSFVSSGSVQQVAALLDEMLKLFVLKTRKSITPAYVNTSGRVIDRKALSPGRISMGIDPDALKPIATNETQGVTAGELGIMKELQVLINKSTVSDQFTGQPGGAGTTATEVVELQRQARLTLGLTIAVCALLEKKLGYLRLWNILENWFEPTDNRVQQIGEARELVNVYRSTNRETNIPGEGLGERMVQVVGGDLPSPGDIRAEERAIESSKGFPVRKIYLNSEGIKTAKVTWFIQVTPKEKESSSFFKLTFREMLGDMLQLMQLGSVPNVGGLEEEFSLAWGKNRSKLFQKGTGMMGPEMAGVGGENMPAPRGRSPQAGSPNVPSAGALGMGMLG